MDPDDVPIPEHGGVSPAKGAKRIVDLSLSTNPWGPPPFLDSAIERARKEVTCYPDRKQLDLCRRIEKELKVDPGEVLVGGSASEMLRASITAFGARRVVLLPRFTYQEYERVALSVGAKVLKVPMPGLCLNVAAACKVLTDNSLVVIPNPGTPFASYLSPDEMMTLVGAVEEKHALLIVDESYLPFVAGAKTTARVSPSVVTIFSWSKALGTPGLPFGHAVAHPAVLRAIATHMVPWSVGPFSRHLALLALANKRWVMGSLEKVLDLSEIVRIKTGASTRANYFVIEAESGGLLQRKLLERGYAVRDLAGIGLPQLVRFGVRGESETLAFLDEVRDLEPDCRFL